MKEAAHAEIKKRILSGEFAQGRFLSERQLAVQ
jgi:DNA-binding GntR family transcriptional regulator